MTYIYHVLRDGPVGLWSLDLAPFDDSSGYNNDASYSGSPTTTRPIVSGGVSAQLMNTGDSITYPIDTFMIENMESRAFSLEAWIKVKSGNTGIIKRDNSGLFVDGLTLQFSLEFDSVVTIEYEDLIAGEIYHVVGTYDGQSMILYVNGVAVATEEIDFTSVTGGIADTTSTLSTDTDSYLVVDTIAVYNYTLNATAVSRHYSFGTSYPEIVNLSLINGGKYYLLTDSHASVYDSVKFGIDDDWKIGLLSTGASVIDSELVNLQEDTTDNYIESTWTYQYSVDGDIGNGVTLNGSRITWLSIGAITVELSSDNVTWTPVSNGDQISGVVNLSSGYGIGVRVTLPSGSTQSIVSSLSLVFYTSKVIKGSDESLPATFNSPLTVTLSENEIEPASFNDNLGANVPAGLSIPADTDFGGYFAVEMAVYITTSTVSKTVLYVNTASSQPSITSNGSGQWVFSNLTALYIDGVAVASPYSITTGQWHHVLAVFPESLAPVYVGNNVATTASYPMRLGYLALYSDTITSTMATAIYDMWVGVAAIQLEDSDTIQISEHSFTETTSPFRAYTFDWSITGAG
jgi:hypothetical protein